MKTNIEVSLIRGIFAKENYLHQKSLTKKIFIQQKTLFPFYYNFKKQLNFKIV